MSPEQLLMAGIGALTCALTFVCRLLWTKVEDCEVDRHELYLQMNSLQKEQRDFLQQKTEVLATALANNTAALTLNTFTLNRIEKTQP